MNNISVYWTNSICKIRRKMGRTPMQKVFKELKIRGIVLKELNGLELFGYTGNFHTKDYEPFISQLDVWEINSDLEGSLRKNLPNANIKITDTFEEIKLSKKIYNLVVIDNNIINFGKRCEHFDLFPYVFNIIADSSIIIINILPEINSYVIGVDTKRESLNEHLIQRQEFYKTEHPENISIDEMIQVYKNYCQSSGFDIEWYFTQKRSYVFYLVLKLKRMN